MPSNFKKITAIKTLQKKVGMCDDDYRAMLEQLTGLRSCTKLSEPQLNHVLEYLHRLEQQMFGGSAGQIGLIRHLWATMYQYGMVQNNSPHALDSYCLRMVKTPLGRCTPPQCQRLIECLKRWWRRAANPAHVVMLENMLVESHEGEGHVIQ